MEPRHEPNSSVRTSVRFVRFGFERQFVRFSSQRFRFTVLKTVHGFHVVRKIRIVTDSITTIQLDTDSIGVIQIVTDSIRVIHD